MTASGAPRTSRPWEARYRPDEATVAATLAAQFPALATAEVRRFAEGWDFTVFEVGTEWIVRFPKREATLPWMEREAALLTAIDGRVPTPIPTERFRGEPTTLFPLPFVGYRRLPGVPLDTLRLDAVEASAARSLGAVVGATLRVVHAVPLDRLPPAPSPRDEMAEWIATALDVLQGLEARLPRTAVAACRRTLERPPPATVQPVVTHADLGPEHVLVDDRSHALTGLIDWTDASPWDPAADFVGLWVELGESCLAAALDAYACQGGPQLQDRVRFHGTRWLLHQVKCSDDGWRPETRERWIDRLGQRMG